ncbi:hypothetical protein SAMN05216417_1085 [Nitrosospira multiformis]|uniref:Uncharacterized protein n=1 Tax=Nitrosospira multiformis TaxID=1231 RepID=A0A1I7HAY6_9PROT|nr:hypothetical protein SAMN05216417_1085 [Nitrosospira multiformis]
MSVKFIDGYGIMSYVMHVRRGPFPLKLVSVNILQLRSVNRRMWLSSDITTQQSKSKLIRPNGA